MCVDYSDLNMACPKVAYPLPNIDKAVENLLGFKLSFMDAYSEYNQIPHGPKRPKEDNLHGGDEELLLSSDTFQTQK